MSFSPKGKLFLGHGDVFLANLRGGREVTSPLAPITDFGRKTAAVRQINFCCRVTIGREGSGG